MKKIKIFIPILLFMSGVMLAQPIYVSKFNNYNIKFEYYSDWEISEQQGWSWFSSPYVFLESKGSGIIMINVYKIKNKKTLEQLVEEFTQHVANASMFFGELKNQDSNPISINGFKGRQQNVHFNSLIDDYDETHLIRKYFSFSSEKYFATIILQVEDHDIKVGTKSLEKVLSSFKLNKI